jgi:2-polyprenyl-3-methyl-5-hydroxy-6-metoxy-1,4-benzoquinol methylase
VSAFAETADVETSSEDYARRFAGPVGAWFLERQAATTIELLGALPRGARLLDVGGGHAQLTPVLVDAGYDVVVIGSDASCAARLAPWLAGERCRFEVGDVIALPYADRSFDGVLSFRLLPHVSAWQRLIAELCRVASRAVVFDYPSSRSVNVLADALFAAKKRVERNTRPFTLFAPGAIRRELAAHRFAVTGSRPQFLWPMVLHRMLGNAAVARALEAPARWTGLTRLLGSPVIVRAERR